MNLNFNTLVGTGWLVVVKHNTFLKILNVFFYLKVLFYFWGSKSQNIKIRDSLFVDLDIVYLFCVLCAVSLKTVSLLGSQTFGHFLTQNCWR